MESKSADHRPMVGDILDCAILLLDSEGLVQSWNKGAEKIKGYQPEEIIGRHFRKFYTEKDVVDELPEKLLAEALRNGRALAEGWRARKDGTLFWGDVTLTTLFDEKNNVSGFLKVTRDITTLRNSQTLRLSDISPEADVTRQLKYDQAIETLLEHTDESLIIADTSLNLISFNEHAKEQILEYFGIELIKGISILRLPFLKDLNTLKLFYEDVLSGNTREIEFSLNSSGNREIHAVCCAKPLKPINGSPEGIFVSRRDVTEIVIARQRIEFEHGNLNALINNTRDNLWSIDLNYNLITFNQKFYDTVLHMSGISVALGMSVFDMGFSEERNNTYKGYYKRSLSGEVFTVLEHIDQPEERWDEISFYPIREGDKIIGSAGFGHDITLRKKYEENINASEHRFRALIENSSDGIAMIGADGEILYRSRSAEKLSGYLQMDINDNSVFSIIYPDDVEIFKEILKKSIANPGIPHASIHRVKNKTFGHIFVEATLTNLLSDKNVRAIVLNFRDINERMIAEEETRNREYRFRALTDHSHDGVTLLTSDGKPMYITPSVKKILGYSEREIQQYDIFLIAHPEDQNKLRQALDMVLANPGVSLKGYTGRLLHKSGNWRWIEATAINMLHDPNISGLIVNFRDITERKNAAEKLMHANRLYAFISQINQTIVRATSENTVFAEACNIAVRYGKFQAAWIGIIDFTNEFINLVSSKGLRDEDKQRLCARYEVNGPTDYVLRTGTPYICNDIANDLEIVNWRQFAAINHFASCMVLPVRRAGLIIGTFNLYAGEKNFFSAAEAALLKEATSDISFALDVFMKETVREQIEVKLKNSEQRLKQAQAIAHFGNWELDYASGTAYWSDETCKIYGVPIEQNKHQESEWFSFVHPADLEFVEETMKESAETLSNTSFYNRIVRNDGTLRFVHTQTEYALNKEGAPTSLLGVVRDITETKEAEAALAQSESNLRLIMDLIPQSIFARNADGVYMFVNKSYAKLFGLQPEQMINKKQSELNYPPEHYLNLFKYEQEVMETGQTRQIPDLKFTNHEGNTLIFYTIKVPFTIAGKNERGVLGIALDITDQKISETERTKMIADIVQRNKDLEQFSYIVSHNLRAPVANIIGIGEVLKLPGITREEEIEIMGELSTSVKKLDNVIMDLNHVLQVKHHINERKENVSFLKLIRDITFSIDNIIKEHNVVLKCDFSELDEMLTLKSFMHSIFLNLITNSIKYRQPDLAPLIEIKTTKLDNGLRVVYRDNGLGIDMERKKDQVFGLYKRFHNHVDGKGIGLFMVKTQVESLGGSISVQSEVNKGIEFIIEFEY